MSAAIMSSCGPAGGCHVVDATITGAHLARAHKAIRQGVYKDIFTVQSAVDWVVLAVLQRRVAMPVKDTLCIVTQSSHLPSVILNHAHHAAGASCQIPIKLAWSIYVFPLPI